MNRKNIFLGVFLILAVVLSLYFVLAAAKAPTGLHFQLNTSINFDNDGIFFLNWTNNSLLDSAFNIYITVNGTDFTNAVIYYVENDSGDYSLNPKGHGYRFDNQTGANYTFIVEAVNAAAKTNSTWISITVDAEVPELRYDITGSEMQNDGANVSQNWIYVNVTFEDEHNHTLTFKLYNDTGRWNITHYTGLTDSPIAINWTGLADGEYTHNASLNDSATNVNTTTLQTITLDTTDPTASASCDPSLVTAGASFPCSCGGTDTGGSGINTSETSSSSSSPDEKSTPSSTGTFTYTCSVTDYAGNTHSATATYTVESQGSDGSGNGADTTTWTTHAITQAQFQAGYTSQIQANKRIRVQVGGQDHHVGVVSLTASQATIEISSDPVQVTLDVGEDAKVDVTDDGFYDIYVILNDIVNNKADVTILEIHEEIPEGEDGVATTGDIEGEEEAEEEEASLLWLWILIAVVVVIVVIGGGVAVAKKKNQ